MSLQNSIEISTMIEALSSLTADSIDGYGLVENLEYLARGQVDTPVPIVDVVWNIAHRYRKKFSDVIDAGAGDGRFSTKGEFDNYYGFEIDEQRAQLSCLPPNASIERCCAFSGATSQSYDLSIGNPPYVRHHDISDDWRTNISMWIKKQVGIKPSGMSNAYIYFLWLSLIVTRGDGLVVLLIPSEWVARPINKLLLEYIKRNGWTLDIYRFENDPFPRVLTTGSVTVIDKKGTSGDVSHYLIDALGDVKPIVNDLNNDGVALPYYSRDSRMFAQRGFSPGGQAVFVLTESERVHYGLLEGRDVVSCITTLRHVPSDLHVLDRSSFEKYYVSAGKRCWLICPSGRESARLKAYLASVPENLRDNYTCNKRSVWWRFARPVSPDLVYSSGFRGRTTKVLENKFGVVSVGAVCGIYSDDKRNIKRLARVLQEADLEKEIVAVSRGFTKIEINQMNAFIQRFLGK